MPTAKCLSCGYVADYEENSNCVQCTGFVIIDPPSKPSGTKKVVGLVIATLLVLAGVVYGVNSFFAKQQENARVEAEKKRLETFDYITFNADADSVSNGISLLPTKYKSPPPTLETIKQTISDFVGNKKETKSIPLPDNSGINDDAPTSIEQITVYTLKGIEPLQYDYVKGEDGKLVCFVSYRAVIQSMDRQQEATQYTPQDGPIIGKTIDKPLSENTVNETARYDLENGIWKLKQAGISELGRKSEIDKVRLEAKYSQTK